MGAYAQSLKTCRLKASLPFFNYKSNITIGNILDTLETKICSKAISPFVAPCQ